MIIVTAVIGGGEADFVGVLLLVGGLLYIIIHNT